MSDDIEKIRGILVERKVIAVVGLSANWWRPSFFAAKYMQDHGYQIIPVNPNYDEILGEACYPSLEDIPKDISVDIVDVFKNLKLRPPLQRARLRSGQRCYGFRLASLTRKPKPLQKRRFGSGCRPIASRSSTGGCLADSIFWRDDQSHFHETPQMACLLILIIMKDGLGRV